MSPNTQVALIALILFFAVATISIFWPRLAGPKRSSMKLASGVMPDTIKVLRSALSMAEAKLQDRPLSPHLQTGRWTRPMATSLMHRIAGGALGLGTILLLAFW